MSNAQIFTFDNPQQISSGAELIGYFGTTYNGQYYDLPFPVETASDGFKTLLYLRSAMQVKINILCSSWVPHPLLTLSQFKQLATDYLWLGNAYLGAIRSRTNRLLALDVPLARYTRADKNNIYKYITNDASDIYGGYQITPFPRGSIYQLRATDLDQEIYGVPEWLPAYLSAKLNEAATMFRMRYYKNGSHAGYIIYISDPNITEPDATKLAETLKNSKGPGNFRNMMLYAPNGQKDGIQLMPLSQTQAKDEFFNIKAVSRDDQLASIRVPPNIMGIVPQNTSGFGNVTDAVAVFARNEVEPLQQEFAQINQWLGVDVFKFNPYQITTPEAN